MPMFWLTSAGATVALRSLATRMWLFVIVVPLKASVPPAPLNMPMHRSKSKICRLEMVQFWFVAAV